MAQLTTNMSHRAIIDHLREEICATARKETGRLVTARDPALFGAVRGIMCDVDYLAALWDGWNGTQRHRIATREKSVRFIREVISVASDDGYREFAKHLYDLYRCGVVHLRAPKLLKSSGRSTEILTWLLMYDRSDSVTINRRVHDVEHLRLLAPTPKLAYLPVSIKTFFDDFLASCEHAAQAVEAEERAGDAELRDRWRSAADALVVPEPTTLRW